MIVDIENWLWKSDLGTFCSDFLTVCLKVGESHMKEIIVYGWFWAKMSCQSVIIQYFEQWGISEPNHFIKSQNILIEAIDKIIFMPFCSIANPCKID